MEQFSNWQIAAQAQISNLSANNIDWAMLAAEWIQLRETSEPSNSVAQPNSELLDAPPPPQISAKSYHPKAFKHLEEQGEAEMDTSDDDDEPVSSTSSFNTASQFETIPLQLPVPTPRVQPVLNYHLTQYQSQQDWQWPPRVQLPPPVLHIPQVTPVTAPSQPEPHEKPVETLDENKRKSLPAWLREGLEKMEKEKQKQMDRDKDKFNHESITEKSKRPEKEIKSLVKSTFDEMASDKSNSESDEDTVGEEETVPTESPSVKEETAAEIKQEMVKKSQEEIVEEMMLVVRRSLTELLLEVTNEEILSIAQEQYKRKKLKASTSVQVFHKSALSAITGNLGLGAYDDSSEEGDSDDNSDIDAKNNGLDSEDEIRNNLRLARKNFRSIEQSIEEYLLNDQHQQERRKEESAEIIAQPPSKKSTPERNATVSPVAETSKTDIGETQPDKRYHGNGKRSKERTSRFSENKGTAAGTFFVQPHHSTGSSSGLLIPPSMTENPLFNAKVASPTRKRRRSDSSDDDHRSNSSKSSSKHSYKSSRSSYRHKKSSRRSDDDSDDYYSSSRHSKKSRHKHKKSRSRSRSRSRSKSSYSSSSSKRRH